MNKVRIFDIKGMEFPAGRRTRVMLGENGAIRGEYFCQGYVVIYPGGSVPQHEHETVESYTVLQGNGLITVDGETQPIGPGEMVYMERGKPHSLQNTGDTDMHMMFVYAPQMVVDHWAREAGGELS